MGGSGYGVLPALNVLEASAFTQQLKVEIDLLIVNPLLTGVADFINTLRCSQGSAKLLALSDRQPVDLPFVNASLGKPDRLDQHTGIGWLYAVERLLAED